MSFFKELQRRNVFRVGIAYLALAWLLIEVADTLFPAFGVPDWGIRFLVILFALGFVPALVVSWVYELTPEGIKREKDVRHEASVTPETARRLDLLTIGLIVAALSFILADRFWFAPGAVQPATALEAGETELPRPGTEDPGQRRDSIAVLPFANRSANPDDLFFVDGVHDDLLTHISRIGTIKTISRTSVMKYRDTTLSIPEIARELDVATVLEGGVQRAGDQIRINVQLIDARTDDHIWSQIYDRQLTATNIFTIQSEIAGAITEALRATLTQEARDSIQAVPTDDLNALEAYFLGRQRMAKRTVAGLEAAVGHFETAVTLDAEFALAHVELANALRLHGAYAHISEDEWNERRARIRAAVETALRLDPLSAEAYTALAFLRMSDGDEEAVEAAFRRALELNPNYASALQWYGEWLGVRPGRIDEALELTARAVSLDPLSAIINNDHGEVLQNAGRLQEALAYYQKAIDIEPDFAVGYRRIARLRIEEFGRIDQGLQALSQSHAIDPNWGSANWLSRLYLDLGDTRQAAAWRDRALELAPEGVVPDSGWLLQFYRGEDERAAEQILAELERDERNGFALGFLAEIYVRTDRPEAARALYRQGFPELFETGAPSVDRRNAGVAVDLANVLLRTGEHDQAHRLLDLSEATGSADQWKSPHEFVLDARIHALRGDRQQALAALRAAVDRGFRNWAWVVLGGESALAPLHGMPMFESIRTEVDQDLKRQLAAVHAWQDSG